MTIDRIIGLDCESNGLHGQIFAAAATVQHRDEAGQIHETATWTGRVPIVGPVEPWVAENVLPGVDDIPVTEDWTTADLHRAWRQLYDPLRADSYDVVVHVPWPVEARFLWDAHASDPFSGPFPLLDTASMLTAIDAGDPTDLDTWFDWLDTARHSPPPGAAHHPLYDARRAALAYWTLAGKARPL